MTDKKRLPVHRRVENPPGMKLTLRDREIVKTVYEYRFMSREQIGHLFFPSRSQTTCQRKTNRRLQGLYQHRYLNRIFVAPEPESTVRNTPPIYCLDEEGTRLIAVELGVPREQIRWYPDRNKVKEYFLQHTLEINDFRVAMTLALKERGGDLVEWVPEWEVKEFKQNASDPKKRITYPVVPDAYFICEFGNPSQKSHFFLELDRGTMENRRFGQKVKAYMLYKGGIYKEQYGAQRLRVLTVVPSQRRLRNLKKTTEKEGGKGMFWFTTSEEIEPKRILGEVWLKAGVNGFFSLFDQA